MKKTARQWLMSLKDEHRDLALANMFEDAENEIYESLEDALYGACKWAGSPQGEDFWCDIHTQIEAGTYFDTPQLTPQECTRKGKESIYGLPKVLPTDADKRKEYPIYQGFIKYFPNAIAAVSNLSYNGSQQHQPDEPTQWDMDKSQDELDALMRHMIDGDWEQVAWRAMANLERKLTGKCQYTTKEK